MKIDKINLPSNFNFGIFFTFVFLSFSIYFYFSDNNFWYYLFLSLGLIILFISFINADILFSFNKFWFNFGLLLGKIVSPIVMGLIFFGIFTPIGILMKIMGRDELRLGYKTHLTYWIKRNTEKQSESFKRQF